MFIHNFSLSVMCQVLCIKLIFMLYVWEGEKKGDSINLLFQIDRYAAFSKQMK